MRLSFDTYWPLLLLLIIPYLWWVQRRTLTDLSPKHLQVSGAVRSTIVLLIALALMQPVLYRTGAWLSVDLPQRLAHLSSDGSHRRRVADPEPGRREGRCSQKQTSRTTPGGRMPSALARLFRCL